MLFCVLEPGVDDDVGGAPVDVVDESAVTPFDGFVPTC
jgi:hypothetical protein